MKMPPTSSSTAIIAVALKGFGQIAHLAKQNEEMRAAKKKREQNAYKGGKGAFQHGGSRGSGYGGAT